MVGQTEHLTAELAAVWDEMFDAVARILKAAEEISDLADKAGQPLAADLAAAAGEIFEACAFQDITGQRIANVVAELSVGGDIPPEEAPKESSYRSANDEDLLNGPQLPGNALGQDAIDDLFSTMLAKA